MSDISEKIVAHINAALAFERPGRKITTPQAFSKGKSSRPMCNMCGVGIRKETADRAINGMHPKCALVASDPSLALNMGLNTHAARAIADRIAVQLKLNNADISRADAEKKAHAEMLARFEANEQATDAAS
jgi:hypothetical protein